MATGGTTYLEYPPELKTNTEGHYVLFESYPSLFGGGVATTPEFSIALPMSAQALISTAEAVYAEQEGLGTVLSETAAKVSGELAPYFTSGQDGGDITSKLANMIPTATQGESVVESSVQQMIRKNDFLKRAVGGLNVAVNPKMSLLYQGPGKFRQFTFEFPMIAKSEAESETIRQIIKFFRSATLPGYTENHLPNGGAQAATGGSRKRGAGSNFFSFPNKFRIKFGHAGTTGGSSYKGGGAGTPFKIATSVCKSAVVNYAAAGVPFFFENGAPFEIKMTLTFMETVIITKELVEDGF